MVVDPFAGGGSIPLEALRVGADAFASDLNPVAVLLNKVVLEYIPKYGQRLADEVRRWGAWITQQAAAELAEIYPNDPDGATPIAYLWARTILCEGPGCGVEFPLIRSTVLSTKHPISYVEVGPVHAHRVALRLRDGKEPFTSATVRGGRATCPVCGYTTGEKRVKQQMAERDGGGNTAILFAVLTQKGSTRLFREPTAARPVAVDTAVARFNKSYRSDPSTFPTEEINPLRPYKNTVGVCIVTRIGVKRFLDLYTSRQAEAIARFQKVIKRVADQHSAEERGMADAVFLSMHLALDRLVMQNTCFSRSGFIPLNY